MSSPTVFLNKNQIYQAIQVLDPFGSEFIDFRYPVDVWNYIIYCLPFVLFVLSTMFVHIPIVVHFIHWAPKLLWPRLMGFPILHELLRRLTQITNPQPPSAGDFIRYFERLYNLTMLPQFDNSSNTSTISLTSLVPP